jgi:hypothetical protein
MTLSSGAVAQEYYIPEEPEAGHRPMRRLDLSFSIAEGGYIGYRCDTYDGYCDEAFVAPFDFEILAGFRVTRFLSLDLALNFSFDYYGYHYYSNAASEVFVWTSLRPGIRLLLPTFFHQQVYFRAAVPLTFRLKRFSQDDDVFLPGLLFGVGIEWVWGGFGFFIEGDILPYFVAVYPGYFVIPVECRFGVVAHF